jgi:ribosomal protein L37AE/L43A
MAVCRLCKRTAVEIQGWLTRINPLGEEGVWECRPTCGATLTQDARLLGAILPPEPEDDDGGAMSVERPRQR